MEKKIFRYQNRETDGGVEYREAGVWLKKQDGQCTADMFVLAVCRTRLKKHENGNKPPSSGADLLLQEDSVEETDGESPRLADFAGWMDE